RGGGLKWPWGAPAPEGQATRRPAPAPAAHEGTVVKPGARPVGKPPPPSSAGPKELQGPTAYLPGGAGLTSETTPTLSRNLKYASSSVAATGPYSALTASRISSKLRFPLAKFRAS